jgi:Transposase DDE domain
MHATRYQFTNQSLYSLIREVLTEHHQDKPKQYEIPTVDCLMSALGMFSLKYPSLLQFEKDRLGENTLRYNLNTLFGVSRAPCDTQMRERLDGMDLTGIRAANKALIGRLQRGKVLENWKFLEQSYLVPLDGTGFFSSPTVHCDSCCEKKHKSGEVTYHHQMVVGSIVHPDRKQVFPLGFEPVVKSDGQAKNDCELNAAKRWLDNFRKEHPKLPVTVVGDGLFSNGPFISLLEEHGCHYILVAQEKDHQYLYDWFWKAEAPDVTELEDTEATVHKRYRFMENVPLNERRCEQLVNVVFYEELCSKGKNHRWLWVTDLQVTSETVKQIVKAGRARWKIENETFNTLKNQGYHFEHNYGHGNKTLSNVLAGLMLLGFLLDQCLESLNVEFIKSLQKCGSRARLWEDFRFLIRWCRIESWDVVYVSILDPPKLQLI